MVRACRAGIRPVVVLSRDSAIPRLRRALVAPCTTTIRGLASQFPAGPQSIWTRLRACRSRCLSIALAGSRIAA